MELETLLQVLVLVIGFYMAWNIGANDVSNAMGTSVGSKALTLKKAVFLAAILEFCGAFFVGGNVSETMQSGLIDTAQFANEPMILILGMCAALLGTSVWLQIASYFGWPVSTTHAIVGSILGFGGIIGGVDAIQWGEIGSIALSWIITPAVAGVLSYAIFSQLQRLILFAMNPIEATRKFFPWLVALVFTIFSLSLLFNGLENLKFSLNLPTTIAIGLCVGGLAYCIALFCMRRAHFPELEVRTHFRYLPQTVISLDKAIKHLQRVHLSTVEEEHAQIGDMLYEVKALSKKMRNASTLSERTSAYAPVERMFVYLQILSACFVAFAHGANDVANAIGPVAAVMETIKNHAISPSTAVPVWLLAFGGVGIVIGLATWGWRVIETIGKKITELTPTRGFCAEFGAAATILIASKLGMPISTTHCLVGAILGVGLARGISALNLTMLRDIVLSWVITLPASAAVSILAFYALKAIFI